MKRIIAKIRDNPLLFASIIGTVIIPLIYGGLYLWAFWDPYTGMKNAKVAVVNLDTGAEKDGESYQFGNKVIDKLKDDHNLSWQFVSKDEADQGMKKNTYYAVLTIPSNFSANLISVDSDNPIQAHFKLTIRDTNSYFASKFTKTAINELARKLRKEVEKEYFDNLYVNIRTIGDGLKEGSDGAWKLTDGLSEAKDGSQTLFDGLTKIKDGVSTLTNGISDLFDGSKKLKDGIQTARDGSNTLLDGITKAEHGSYDVATGSAALTDGANKLNEGAEQLSTNSAQILGGINTFNSSISSLNSQYGAFNTGMTQLQSGFSQVPSSLQQAANDLSTYAANNPSASSSAQFVEALTIVNALNNSAPQLSSSLTSLVTASSQINTGVTQLSTSMSNFVSQYILFNAGVNSLQENLAYFATNAKALSNGAKSLDEGLLTIRSGATTLHDGLVTLTDGSSTLSASLNTALDGSNTLSSGITDAKNGSDDLHTGLIDAYDGSHELATKLWDSANEIAEKTNVDKNEKQTSIMSDSDDVEENHIAEVKNNGTAFAPYFIPLSLWVGAMSIFFVLQMPQNRKYKKFSSWIRGQKVYGIALCIGLMQALVLPYVMTNGLHLSAINYPALYAYCILLSVLFVSLQYLLLRLLSNVGRFVGIILLMLQLTSSSGTYPVETSDIFFKFVSSFLPMTYGVRTLREIITGGNWSIANPAALITIYMAIGCVFFCLLHSYAFPRTRKLIHRFTTH